MGSNNSKVLRRKIKWDPVGDGIREEIGSFKTKGGKLKLIICPIRPVEFVEVSFKVVKHNFEFLED